jgi:signal transduction histidine kinase
MHDTLIQGCAGVSLLLEAASAGGAADSAAQVELLDYARTQLAASIDEARQAVWNLRGQESADFGETLRKLAERLGKASHVAFACEVEGEIYDFHASAMHEIAMASREAIYNALLHANPTRIDVRASFGEEEFALTVEDNGSGFDSSNMGTEVYIRVPRAAVCFEHQRQAEKQAVEEMVG